MHHCLRRLWLVIALPAVADQQRRAGNRRRAERCQRPAIGHQPARQLQRGPHTLTRQQDAATPSKITTWQIGASLTQNAQQFVYLTLIKRDPNAIQTHPTRRLPCRVVALLYGAH